MRRINTCQQRKIAGDHQPLNMVRVGHIAGLRDRMLHTGHFGGCTPINRRQIAGLAQPVLRRIVRTVVKIDSAHKFAPADDLANKSLGGIYRHKTRLPCRLDPLAYLHRRQKADIYIGRQQRMGQNRIGHQHRILIVAKRWQGVGYEMIQRLQRPCPVCRPAKG